jgi:hypothetical protein
MFRACCLEIGGLAANALRDSFDDAANMLGQMKRLRSIMVAPER